MIIKMKYATMRLVKVLTANTQKIKIKMLILSEKEALEIVGKTMTRSRGGTAPQTSDHRADLGA
jgi:hypothetical protein